MLVGHSLGAVAALLAAGDHSERYAGVVLTCSAFPVARAGRSGWETALDYGRHRVAFVAAAAARTRQRRTERRRAPATAAGLRSLAALLLRPAAFHRHADRIVCPVLVIHGARDHHVPPAFARSAVERHRSWRLVEIAEAGHFPQRETPAAWLEAVETWLEREVA